MRKIGTFEGIGSSDDVESKATQVAAYCISVSTPLATHRVISVEYLIEA